MSASVSAAPSLTTPGDTATLLVGGNIIDGTGAARLVNTDVLLVGDQIVAVGKNVTAPQHFTAAQVTRVDCTGLTVMPGITIALDIGGTFTDLAAFDESTGKVYQAKSSTTPKDLAIGIRETLKKSGLDLSRADTFVHGSTTGINTAIDRKSHV